MKLQVMRSAGALRKFCEEEGGTVLECSALPSVYVDRSQPFLKKLAEAYEEETGLKNQVCVGLRRFLRKSHEKYGFGGPILPGMEDTCHEENEYIKIEDLITNFNI